ncbi:putative cytochrome c' [Azoarcus olearius]|uniref:c-type cytochrome n=1 Tax=Azoarcus sp. (strain BH72) TaxID=418699 RepID=UPI0008064114|nr:cytochrome c [Azoarcus olearius]ANQ83430.1 putative cytochrome c' [Azoarcus olearius]
MPRPLLPALLILLTLAGCGPVEDTRPGQPVKQRQEAFKSILRSFEPMGVMLRDNKYQADKFASLAGELVAKRDAPWSHFGPDTNYPPTKAKAAVWSEGETFERERLAFVAATDALFAAAQTRDQAQAKAAYEKVYGSCKSCHDRFKEK